MQQMQYIVVAFLVCFSVVSGDWLIKNRYDSSDRNCNAPPTDGSAYPLNFCMNDYQNNQSSIYSYNSSTPTFYNTIYYRALNCTDETTIFTRTTNFSRCSDGQESFYSPNQPKLSGVLTAYYGTNSCSGEPEQFTVRYVNACVSTRQSSSNIGYFGGDVCVNQYFGSTDCSGTPTEAFVTSFETKGCQSGELVGCAINGVFLNTTALKPTYDPSEVVVTKFYSSATDCSGTAGSTLYSQEVTCDGRGRKTFINGDRINETQYDHYNCTGHVISTVQQVTVLNNCTEQNEGPGSMIATQGTFPSSYSGLTTFSQDTCNNPTVIYSAYESTPGCLLYNVTQSTLYTCTDLGNGTITFESYLYNNTGCSGEPESTYKSAIEICQSAGPGFGYYVYYCPSSSPTAAPPTTSGTNAPTSSPTTRPTSRPPTPTSSPTTQPVPTSSPTTRPPAPSPSPTIRPTSSPTPTSRPSTTAAASGTTGRTATTGNNSTSSTTSTSSSAAAAAAAAATGQLTSSAYVLSASMVGVAVAVVSVMM